jgi:hypothetical protein
VAESQGKFGNPEKGERQPLELVTRRLVTQLTENTYTFALVNFRRCISTNCVLLLVVTSCKCPVNSISNAKLNLKLFIHTSIYYIHIR